MARASTWTLLSLDRYFQLMGLNPSHANGGATGTTMAVSRNACQDVWTQHPWQGVGRVSREDLAEAIADAERDIAGVLGWWPAPVWTVEDQQPYPRHYRPEVWSYNSANARGMMQPVRAQWGNIIAPGRRAVDGYQNVAVVLSDADGDGLNETATVTATDATWTDVRQIKVYFEIHSGDQVWEVRPPRTRTLTPAGVMTATFWAWQLIDPDLWEALPAVDEPEAIDWSVAANIVDEVDVYREYNDTTDVSAELYWEPVCNDPVVCSCGGTGCTACQLTTQDGCFHLRDPRGGLVVPAPGSYDDDNAQWAAESFAVCRDPDFVKLWYYSGLISDEYLTYKTMDPLPQWLAMSIAQMATARLQKPLCACSNVTALADEWRRDLAMSTAAGTTMLSEDVLNNPFGTRMGEVLAWRRVSKLALRRGKVALI